MKLQLEYNIVCHRKEHKKKPCEDEEMIRQPFFEDAYLLFTTSVCHKIYATLGQFNEELSISKLTWITIFLLQL